MDFIRKSRLEPGDQLPPEVEMAGQLGVSRSRIREVYVQLLADGVIVRRHGQGTFVGQLPVRDDQIKQAGFAASIRAAGLRPTVEVIACEQVTLDETLASRLGHAEGVEVSRLLRLFRADGRPAVLVEDYLSPEIRAERIDLKHHAIDLVGAMALQVDMRGSRIDTWTTAVSLELDKAEHLALKPGAAALHIHSAIISSAGAVLCISWTWFNPELVELNASRAINVPPHQRPRFSASDRKSS